jgi:hypothetical protein
VDRNSKNSISPALKVTPPLLPDLVRIPSQKHLSLPLRPDSKGFRVELRMRQPACRVA